VSRDSTAFVLWYVWPKRGESRRLPSDATRSQNLLTPGFRLLAPLPEVLALVELLPFARLRKRAVKYGHIS
jgi:hypothetical protein